MATVDVNQPELNPYVPPASNVERPPGEQPIVRAGRWRRFGTLVVDSIGLWLLGTVLGVGTRVVDQSGGPPRFTQILGRTLSRLIPFEGVSFFGEWGWHDRFPRTYVILTRVPEDVETGASAKAQP